MKYFLCVLRSSMLDEKTIETVVNYFLPSIEFKLCDYIVCFINVFAYGWKTTPQYSAFSSVSGA